MLSELLLLSPSLPPACWVTSNLSHSPPPLTKRAQSLTRLAPLRRHPPPPPLQDISKMPLGVKALATYPLKSAKRDKGLRDVPVSFAGVTVRPGDWVYADKVGGGRWS